MGIRYVLQTSKQPWKSRRPFSLSVILRSYTRLWGEDLAKYTKMTAWLKKMEALPHWKEGRAESRC